MEIQFSSGIIWTVVSALATVGLIFPVTRLIRKCEDAEGDEGIAANVVGAILCVVLFVGAFIALVHGGIEIFKRLQW